MILALLPLADHDVAPDGRPSVRLHDPKDVYGPPVAAGPLPLRAPMRGGFAAYVAFKEDR